MARQSRLVISGCPHHVTHRGNGGETIFHSAEQHRLYLEWLREYAAEHGLKLWAYCLMPNHVHLVAVPERKESLALAVGQAHVRYSRWVGFRHGTSGHLWASRFYSTPVDEAHLWTAIRYVELNPVRAGLVARAEEYRWSSARAHVLGVPDPVLAFDLPLGGPAFGEAWRAWLAEGMEEELAETLRRCTRTGHPLGSEEFVSHALRERK